MTIELKTVEELVVAGNAALTTPDWEEARRCFESALAREESVAAWEGLSWATSWLGDTDASLAAREQAFRAYRAAGDVGGAARMAGWLANDALHFRGDDAVAAGWLERGRSLLDGRPPSAGYGWLLVIEGYYALEVDADPETAASKGAKAAALGAELSVPDLEALGIAIEGAALVVQGRVNEGLRRLDEAAAVCAGEEFELPISPAWALCILIAVCERVGDFARVVQWCEAMRSIGERLNGRHLIGVCRSAYGQVLTCRGEWPAAEAELVASLGDLEAMRPGMAPDGLARLGELRARQGRIEEARALFERALPHRPALVGLGTLALEEGDALGAADIAERILRRIGEAAVADVPDELSTAGLIWSLPIVDELPEQLHGLPYVGVAGMWAGDPAEGERATQRLRELATPLVDMSGRMDYVDFQRSLDPFYPAGWRYYWKALYLDRLSDAAIDTTVGWSERRPSNDTLVIIRHCGGAISRVGAEETAFGDRSSEWMLSLDSTWHEPTDDETNVDYTRAFWDAAVPFSNGQTYFNFPGLLEEGDAAVRASYGANHARLARIKATYDPDNRFRLNQNIKPAQGGPA